ncbi:unnamed protein product [Prorocentrum cordatum]|uniref:Uncharacterized protein n=1 Tax=Prorocentrum cordatum TaxID=2364126 RepID=A0ABN9PHP0_9DINO|nr:unnamed protein product [Polarella glacialis]
MATTAVRSGKARGAEDPRRRDLCRSRREIPVGVVLDGTPRRAERRRRCVLGFGQRQLPPYRSPSLGSGPADGRHTVVITTSTITRALSVRGGTLVSAARCLPSVGVGAWHLLRACAAE